MALCFQSSIQLQGFDTILKLRSRSTSIHITQVKSILTHVDITYLFRFSRKLTIYEPKGKQEKYHHLNLGKKPYPTVVMELNMP